MSEVKKDQFVTQNDFKELKDVLIEQLAGLNTKIQEQTQTLRTEFKAGLFDLNKEIKEWVQDKIGIQDKIKKTFTWLSALKELFFFFMRVLSYSGVFAGLFAWIFSKWISPALPDYERLQKNMQDSMQQNVILIAELTGASPDKVKKALSNLNSNRRKKTMSIRGSNKEGNRGAAVQEPEKASGQ